jgi:hypothetical protein
MSRSKPLLRLAYTVLALACVMLVALGFGDPVAARSVIADSPVDFEWSLGNPSQTPTVSPGSDTIVVVTGFKLINQSASDATYTIAVTDKPSGWSSQLSVTLVSLGKQGSTNSSITGISMRVVIPAGAALGTQSMTVTASKIDSGGTVLAKADLFVSFTLTVGTPVPSSQPGKGCPEANDPGNSYDDASLVRVDLIEAHGICQNGDEDWFKFAAVGGKVYSIDIPQMDDGLDLSLELYDGSRTRIASNDDYFNRTPPNAKDKKPRINSWRAPVDGIYVVRVRDTLGIGGKNLGYQFIVQGESYGPTPTTVVEVCNDPYEPDGLPEIAGLIMSNEVQTGRLFCPAGDADWVRFFAIAGRLYIIYTDTRSYKTNDGPEPGADTTLLLVDRDGSRILDFNNDVPGGNTLDSEIQFRPVVDGYYYIQIKNVGDIGNEFIKYDLSVRACPGEYCRPNRPSDTTPAPTTPTPKT